ncbi:MAG TPA: tetratricopeptide repeat protein [Meiothermus sp.]|nr:tetratricopeptide repeat protein [Meiothermus sp.]
MAAPPRPTSPRTEGAFWSLELLGVARLIREGVALEPLERKTAALFAYLALEGPTPRSKIAGLLWPEVDEEKARRNLRQRLHRLKDALGANLIIPEDVLYLDPGLEVDVVGLESQVFTGDYPRALSGEGELLGTHDYDDCLELAEWVELSRERVRGVRREALLAEINRLETAGDYPAALPWAERLLNDDLVSEEAHRRVMRLLYLMGDRAGALKAYHRCREVLRRELDVEPLPETAELARTIDRGSALLRSPAAKRPQIPLHVLRPPTLVGREREWALLEEAYQQGKLVFLRGQPGVGKTRLALDFAASKGRVSLLAARPGDAGVPFSSYARSLRESLAERPELAAQMPPWVRTELSRILPELAEGAPPPPLASEAEKMRLFDALGALTLSTHTDGERVLVSDDAQYLDRASIEAMVYQLNKFGGLGRKGGLPFTIEIYRRGEIDPEVEQNIFFPLLEAGVAVLIEVEPLEAGAVQALLQSLDDPQLGELSPALERYTGGNPMFVLEVLKSLYETGQIERGLPERLAVPGKIGPLIQKRLERLSPAGLRLARTAAVAGADFGPELAGKVLEVSPLDLAEPWAELEAAQVLSGPGFAHDLIYETTLAGVPAPIKTLLHRRIAEYLETHQAEPGRIAQHWLEADEGQAVPFLLEAAKAAQAAYRLTEAADFYHQAAQILTRHALPDQAFEAYDAEAALRVRFDTGARLEFSLGRLEELARTPAQKARAALARANLLTEQGQGEKAEPIAREGLAQAKLSGEGALEARLLGALGNALWLQARFEEVTALLEELMNLYQALGDETNLAVCWTRMGTVLETQSRLHEAIPYNRRAEAVFERVGDQILLTRTLNNLAVVQNAVGLKRDARQTLNRALGLLAQMQGVSNLETSLRMLLGDALRDLGEYGQALEQFQKALELASGFNYWRVPFLYKGLALTYLALGQLQQAQVWLVEASNLPHLSDNYRCEIIAAQGELLRAQGKASPETYTQSEGLLSGLTARIELWIGQAMALPPEAGWPLLAKALQTAQAHRLQGLEIAARTRSAQILLGQNRKKAALEHSRAALELLADFDPVNFYRGEVLGTHCQALQANARREAKPFLETTLKWLLETAEQKVPPLYRESFLRQNPVNRQILEAASQYGIT